MKEQNRLVHWFCVTGMLTILIGLGLTADAEAQEVEVRNVQARQSGDKIVITYALDGDRDEEYQVDLKVSNDNGRSFSIDPTAISGDVGEPVRPGRRKRIIWNVLGDFSRGIEGGGYKFQVIGRKKQSSQFGIGVGSSLPLRGTERFGENIGILCCFFSASVEYNTGNTYLGNGIYTRSIKSVIESNPNVIGRSYGTFVSLIYEFNQVRLGTKANFTYQNFEFGTTRKILTLQATLGTKANIRSISLRPSLSYDFFTNELGGESITNDLSQNWIYVELGIMYKI